MKLFFTLTAILFFFSIALKAQNLNWQWQNPTITSHDLRDVQLIAPGKFVAVGLAGTVVLTNDTGNTWTTINTGIETELNAVHFINSQEGWTTGDTYGNAPNILHTTDGGLNWTTQSTSTTDQFNDIFFVNANRGWVVGESGKVFRTDDGGNSWINQSGFATVRLNTSWFFNPDSGLVAGDSGKIYRTLDAGISWSLITSTTQVEIFSLFFLNDTMGWYGANDKTIAKTVNSGQSWTNIHWGGAGAGGPVTSVKFVSPTQGIGVTLSVAFVTSNGTSFSQIPNPSGSNTLAVAMDANGTALITCQYGRILKSYNYFSWFVLNPNSGYKEFYKITFTDQQHGWCIGDLGTLLITIDGGANWLPPTSPPGFALRDVFFIDNNTGWLVGTNGKVANSVNGGNTWTTQTIGTQYYTALHFPTITTGYAVGENGNIIKTSNGGVTWSPLTSGTTFDLTDVYFLNADTGYVTMWGSYILKTIDGGVNWAQLSGPYPYFDEVQFTTPDSGWFAANNGHVYLTSDGGATLNQNTSACMNDIHIYFANSNVGYVVGHSNNYACDYKFTTDGGQNWTTAYLPFFYNLNSVFVFDTSNVYICGEWQTIIHIGDPVITSINNNDISNNSLLKVFPNPANDNISIVIQKQNIKQAKFAIHDILGRTIINQREINLNSTYTNTIDLRSLSKGLYLLDVNIDGEKIVTKIVKE